MGEGVDDENKSRLGDIAGHFQAFSERGCKNYSPLYELLAAAIARDHEILTVAAHCQRGQPVPHLFFGAVQYLLLQKKEEKLARFYPSITEGANSPESAYPVFRAFVLTYRDEIVRIISSRRVQTNEVGRCSYLYPAFSTVASLAGGHPLALADIGTSAGLNLLWDQYGYRYSDGITRGDPASPVQIACELRGDRAPFRPEVFPKVACRIGIDLNVIDTTNQDEVLWLRALIWPEHRQRVMQLSGAIRIILHHPPELITGNALDQLPEILPRIPSGITPVLFHNHALNQFSGEARECLAKIIADEGTRRDIYRLSTEGGMNSAELILTAFRDGERSERKLANCDGHGRWVEWLG